MYRTRRGTSSSLTVGHECNRGAFCEALETRRLLSVAAPMGNASSAGALLQGPNLIARPLTTAVPASSVPVGSASPVGFTPSQIRSAYGINNIKFGSIVGDGSGQTIAIINAYDNPKFVDSTDPNFLNSDLHKFDVQFGLPDPPSFIKVNQNGGKSYPATDPSWANEAALDVEWVHAIAPKANILLVEANSGGLNDLIGSAVEYARLQPGVSAISMSFAAPEASGESYYDNFFLTPSNHDGITYVAASGDTGSTGGYPAFSPNVVAVGSTTLTLSGSTYSSESGRSNSGGGISQFESKPVYQTSVTQSASKRTIPDVAFNGDPNTGVAVYDSFNGGSQPWYKVGGTSLSAPAWAAMIAIANQGRAIHGLKSLDGSTQTLPRLYQLSGNDFHDITSGNNGFAAGAGYDLVTGRGTPKANTLVPNLAGGGSISGTMFQDLNGNGTLNSGEPGLYHWGCYIDFNNNGSFDPNDIRVFSNASGQYTFSDLPGGITYHIMQGTVTGWNRTTPTSFPMNVTLAADQTITGKNIGQHRSAGSISGHMFNDTNGNGTQQTGEQSLVHWGCFIDYNNNGIFDGSDIREFTNSSGNYTFSNVPLGTYHIVQVTPAGWQRILPTTMPYVVTIGSNGQSVTGINFVSRLATATITGTVFNDRNGNGVRDAGDDGLYYWGVFLDNNDNHVYDPGIDVRVFSDANGNYKFTNVAPGTYKLNEGIVTGWQRTTPSLAGYVLTLAAGQTVTGKDIGNHPLG